VIYTVYVLYSKKWKKIYIGYSSHLLDRFKSHNELSNKDWTCRYRPWEVIYCEYYEKKREAIVRENKLKGGKGREWIWKKIAEEYHSTGFISA
jgi:putative endonuclease